MNTYDQIPSSKDIISHVALPQCKGLKLNFNNLCGDNQYYHIATK